MNPLNIVISISGIVLGVLSLVQVLMNRLMEPRLRRFFTGFFCVLIVYVASNFISMMVESYEGAAWAIVTRVFIFIESTASSLLMLLLTDLLLYTSGEKNYRRTPAFILALGLWFVYMALLTFTQFTDVIYTISAENNYRRGPLYPLLLVPPVLLMLVDFIAFLKRLGRFNHRQRGAFAAFLLIPTGAMLLQMQYYGVQLIVFGTTVAAFILFVYLLSDQTQRFYQREQENEHLRVDIMLSQIQPHFLYNTLGAIQSLCRTEPEEAERMVAKFARYLRGNMDSIAERKAIPFEKELEHTRLYLELEQLRYEDALSVSYDLPVTDFRIPTLTLQPLAENAVRHGVRGSLTGRGTVTISTAEHPDCFTVTVKDDGPGFDPERQKKSDGRSHIGLENVRERLARVSGGRLEIRSAPDEGTSAVIILPKGGV